MFLVHPAIFVWDLAILVLLSFFFATVVTTVHWLKKRKHAKRVKRCLVGFLGLLGFVGFFIVTYGSFIEPRLITVTTADVHFGTKRSLKIAVISDIHAGQYGDAEFLARVVDRVNTLVPDLVLIAGDFLLEGGADATVLEQLEPLKNLHASLGTFAVAGNHDHTLRTSRDDAGTILIRTLEDFGVHVLTNNALTIDLGTERFAIAGIDDPWTGSSDLGGALMGADATVPMVLISHNPDIVLDARSSRAELIVAGHTHGGQVRLPWIGPVGIIPTRLGQAYDQGIFSLFENTQLAITRGIGESSPRARFLAPPEILLLTTRATVNPLPATSTSQ